MPSSQSELRMRPHQPPFEAAQNHPPSEKSRRPEPRRHPLPPQSPFEAFLLHYWSGELLHWWRSGRRRLGVGAQLRHHLLNSLLSFSQPLSAKIVSPWLRLRTTNLSASND